MVNLGVFAQKRCLKGCPGYCLADLYRVRGMFAPIEVNTPASIVTCEVNSRVAPFVCSPVVRTSYVPGAKLGSRTTDEKDPSAPMVPFARVTREGEMFDTAVTVNT